VLVGQLLGKRGWVNIWQESEVTKLIGGTFGGASIIKNIYSDIYQFFKLGIQSLPLLQSQKKSKS
jgi:hypothetical protein